MTARQRWGLTAACVLSAALLAACSASTTANGASSTAGGSASGSAKPAVCATADDLKASLADLGNVNIKQNGTSAVSAQLTKIQQKLQKLKTDAHGQYATQIDALTTALSSLSTNLSAAGSNLNTTTLTALASSIGSVVSAGTSLVTAVSNTC
jgi:Spy/CpxP family protein refolding chaperone